MSKTTSSGNRLREFRTAANLTQAELAERAGISRTAVTAIEGERLVPSVAVALALAKTLGTDVEMLFGRSNPSKPPTAWAWDPREPTSSYWHAEVDGRHWRYPAEAAPMLTLLPDGSSMDESVANSAAVASARQTLVVACCDPAAGLLASEFARASGQRMLILQRSSREALDLLREGRVHLAGLHYSTRDEPERNAEVVRERLGAGYQLLRVARWQEGIATAPGSRFRSVRGALRSKLTWVGREPGSGARQCLDQLLGERRPPRYLARNHRGVAEAIQSGWAEAGVCVRLTSAEAGLTFLPVQEEAYDLCCRADQMDDLRLRALLRVLRSPAYREALSHCPGYDVSECGSLVAAT